MEWNAVCEVSFYHYFLAILTMKIFAISSKIDGKNVNFTFVQFFCVAQVFVVFRKNGNVVTVLFRFFINYVKISRESGYLEYIFL